MGGQSFECGMCHQWFTNKGSFFDHAKAKHRGAPECYSADEVTAYNRAFARGFFGDNMEHNTGYPNAYGRGYHEGAYVRDPHGTTK
jgi:hypothetical protein